MIDIDANDSVKGVISQSGVAPFVFKDGSIKAIPHITEKDGMRIIGANKNFDADAVVDGMWDDGRNSGKSGYAENVEKSQLESVENL